MTLHIVCGWCGIVLEEGSPGARTSHGICGPCNKEQMDKLAAFKKQRQPVKAVDISTASIEELNI
jgi:hypothetical protein